MTTATVSKLKATLSEHLARVKQGEEVLITERGRPIARIVPIQGGAPDDARRMDLARRGIIRLGRGSLSPELLRRLPVATNLPPGTAARIIKEEREDRV